VSPIDMMDEEEIEIVKLVYNRFMDNEDNQWTDIDNNLEFFSYLTDKELVKESKIKTYEHERGIRCSQEHGQVNCFAPYILEAVEIILKLYDETKELHPKNAYILSYYLVMGEMGLIYPTSSAV